MDQQAQARFRDWIAQIGEHLAAAELGLATVRGGLDEGGEAARSALSLAALISESSDALREASGLIEREMAEAVAEFENQGLRSAV